MNRIATSLLALLLSATLFLGCDQIIEVDLPEHQPQLNINSNFNPDSLWFVNLSSSLGITDSGNPEPVTNGNVLVFADGVLLDTFVHFEDGFYVYPGAFVGETAEVGVDYEVRATAPGFDEATGKGRIPSPVEIQAVDVESIVDTINYTSEDIIRLTFRDPGEENFYFVAVVIEDTSVSPPSFGWASFMYTNSPALGAEPLFSNFGFQGLVFSDKSFNGTETTLEFFATDLNRSGTFQSRLVLGTLSEDYYLYGRSYSQFFENQFNPFAEPVMIHSNIEGGLGIFAGFSSESVVLP